MEEFRTGNYWGAAEVFRWLTRLDPKSPRAWQMLSRSLSHIPGRLKDAETALLEAIRLDPFNADYYTDLGHIYLKAGLKKRAKRQFEKALNIDSANGDALKGLNMINTMDDT
jgi:Flp pilus assembly protein TadD